MSGNECFELSLPSDPSASGRAREAVSRALTGWRIPELVDVCAVVVSELVTNAVRYGEPPVSLRLRRNGSQVSLDVHDAGSGVRSQPPAVDQSAESGRGLVLVEALSDDSGIIDVPGEGTTVHASWRLTPSRP